MAITPDGKDWTWVVESRCPECGFDGSAVEFEQIPAMVRDNAARWPEVLRRPNVAVRPNPQTWSALEYAAHVRDVFGVFETRVRSMRVEDDPLFENWDQDVTATAERYDLQDPDLVARDLVSSGERAARAFEVPVAERERTGRRSNGSVFTVDTLARYFVHDPIHHLHDVGVV